MEVECGDLALRSTTTQEFTEEAPIWWHKHHVACSYLLDLLYCFLFFWHVVRLLDRHLPIQRPICPLFVGRVFNVSNINSI